MIDVCDFFWARLVENSMRPMSCKLESPLILRIWHAFWTYFDCYPTFHCLFHLTFFFETSNGKRTWMAWPWLLLQSSAVNNKKMLRFPLLLSCQPLNLWLSDPQYCSRRGGWKNSVWLWGCEGFLLMAPMTLPWYPAGSLRFKKSESDSASVGKNWKGW